jgi:hypothetical protein
MGSKYCFTTFSNRDHMLKGKESEKWNHISRWVTCSLRPPIDFKVVGSQNPRNMLVRRRLDTAVHEWWCSIGFLPVLDMSKLPSQFGRCKGASKGLSGKIPSRPAANVSKPGRITRICCWVVHQNVSSWLHEGYKSDSQAWKRFAMSFDAACPTSHIVDFQNVESPNLRLTTGTESCWGEPPGYGSPMDSISRNGHPFPIHFPSCTS